MSSASPPSGARPFAESRGLALQDRLDQAMRQLPDPGALARQQLRRSRRTIKGCFASAVEQPVEPILAAQRDLAQLRNHLAGIPGSAELLRQTEREYGPRVDELSLLALDRYTSNCPGLQQWIPLPEPDGGEQAELAGRQPDLFGLLDRLAAQQRFAPVSEFQRFQVPPAAATQQAQPQRLASAGPGAHFARQQAQPQQSSWQSREPPSFAASGRPAKRQRRSDEDLGPADYESQQPQPQHHHHRQNQSEPLSFASVRSVSPDAGGGWQGDRVSLDGQTLDAPANGSFITGSRKLVQDMAKQGSSFGGGGGGGNSGRLGFGGTRRRSSGTSAPPGAAAGVASGGAIGGVAGTVTRAVLGGRRRRFQAPRPLGGEREDEMPVAAAAPRGHGRSSGGGGGGGGGGRAPQQQPMQQGGGGGGDNGGYPDTEKGRLIKFCVEEKGLEDKLVQAIVNDMCDDTVAVRWSDIAGLEFAKKTINEIIVWPLQRPDLFSGLLGPPKGILLYGPPGTGKTLIGKAIAHETKARFFAISASSLTSKWHGEGEKLVRTLIEVATICQPSIIFIDEIDALLTKRQDGEFEATRRIKTEFLVQLDGARTGAEDRVVVVGATNRPQELDEAARRRLSKRLYIPLPEYVSRKRLIQNLLHKQKHSITEEQLDFVCRRTKGYSGADLKLLCTEAAFGPIRSLGSDISNVDSNSVRAISMEDFQDALRSVRASVSPLELQHYRDWNDQYGSFPTPPIEEELAEARPADE